MHRSGTSAMTGMLGAMGAALPGDSMPATADNPTGYEESRGLARFNNRLLESAGTRWNDDAAIPPAWFEDPARDRDQDEAQRLLDDAYAEETLFALKDPRLCRLLPFWSQVLSSAGSGHSAVLVLRDPLEVARSLAARKDVPQFRPAAIACTSRALLLWLRYVLDSERHSRDLPRGAVDFAHLVSDWRVAAEPLRAVLPIGLPPPGSAVAAAVAALADGRLHRNRVGKEQGESTVSMGLSRLRKLHASLVAPGGLAESRTAGECDDLASTFDRFVALYTPLRRNADPLAASDDWSQAILAHLPDGEPPAPPKRPRRILFLSAAPASIGHQYRVLHPVAALKARGWQASWLPLAAVPARLNDVDIVVVFRARRKAAFDLVRDSCRARGVPLVYDVDDLIFDAEMMAAVFSPTSTICRKPTDCAGWPMRCANETRWPPAMPPRRWPQPRANSVSDWPCCRTVSTPRSPASLMLRARLQSRPSPKAARDSASLAAPPPTAATLRSLPRPWPASSTAGPSHCL